MGFTLVPAAPIDGETVLPLEDAKAYLKVTFADEDEVIVALRDAAIDWVERHCGVALARREWTWTVDAFGAVTAFPVAPVDSVTGITYRDMAGASINLTEADWRVAGGRLLPAPAARWPSTACEAGAVAVRFTAGFEDAGREAPGLMAAVKMLLGHLYSNRSTVVIGTIANDLPFAVEALCAPYRMPVFG